MHPGVALIAAHSGQAGAPSAQERRGQAAHLLVPAASAPLPAPLGFGPHHRLHPPHPAASTGSSGSSRSRGYRVRASTADTGRSSPYNLAGSAPNVHWRCVPEDHLRAHPLFHELPPPEEVVVESIIDVTRFRQSSWQV